MSDQENPTSSTDDDDAALHRLVLARLIPEWYPKYARPAARALAEQLLVLNTFREDVGVRGIHHVSSRIKTEESVTQAMLEGRFKGLADFPDMVGIRVVVHSRQDVDVFAECFLRQVAAKDLSLLRDELKDVDGYQARHLQLEVPGSYRRNSGFRVRMEVQLRTLSQDLFDTLSRTYWYKDPKVVPNETHRAALVAQMRQAEEIVTALQEEADAAFAADLGEAMSPDSFRRTVRDLFQEEVPVASAVRTVLFQRDRGIQTNGDLRKQFMDAERKKEVEEVLRLDALLPEAKRVFDAIGNTYRLYLMLADGGFEFIKEYLHGLAKET